MVGVNELIVSFDNRCRMGDWDSKTPMGLILTVMSFGPMKCGFGSPQESAAGWSCSYLLI